MMQLPLSQKSRDLVGLLRVHDYPASLLSFILDAVGSDISMRNMFLFWGALLLVDGVFCVDVTVTVMEGDSLTLKPQTVIPEGEDDSALWKIGDSIIARINKAKGRFSTSEGDDERFKGRLKLDHQTGSLTITNTRTNHTGLYTLKISGTTEKSDTFSVTVSDAVKSLSVMEGDTVTLHTGVTDIQRDDQIKWKFGDQDLNGPDDTRWRNIHRNDETGEITIRNIQRDQSGDYELEINTSSVILHRKLHINISEMKPVSEKEGESITLDTGLIEKKGYDMIFWKFKDYLIAEINKGTDDFVKHDTSAGGKFKGRLKMHPQNVSLVISDSKPTDSEVYHLTMGSSSHTIQRDISVTVSAIPQSSAVLWIVIGIVGIVIGIVIGIIGAKKC
ncbi:unnamed protein product [Leuciscus chuanchicus]